MSLFGSAWCFGFDAGNPSWRVFGAPASSLAMFRYFDGRLRYMYLSYGYDSAGIFKREVSSVQIANSLIDAESGGSCSEDPKRTNLAVQIELFHFPNAEDLIQNLKPLRWRDLRP